MIVEHDGRNIPLLAAHWDSSDIDTVFFDWTPMLGGASIVSSVWDVPEGWVIQQQYINQTVRYCGEEYTANGVLLASSGQRGPHLIANTIQLSDGRQYQRSVYVYGEEI